MVVGTAVAASVAGCGTAAQTVPSPSGSPSPSPFLSDAVAITRLQIESALRGRNLALIVPQVPFRPGESPALSAAPRLVVQAVLPQDPHGGFIVVYELPDPAAAYAAGTEMAGYLASGFGRIQFPPDAQPVLRQLGSTLIFFSWSPSTAPDPHTADVQAALETLGAGIPIQR